MLLERGARDKTGPDLCELTLAKVRKFTEELLGDDQLEDRIPQEFKPLVIKRVVLPLQGDTGMGQGLR